MASLSTESSLLVHSHNRGRPKLSFFAFRLKNPVDSTDLPSSALGHLRIVRKDVTGGVLCCARLNSPFVAMRARMIKPLNASGGGSAEGADSEEPEDILQATIEKSKKVLAMQRDLLRQIAERRKLVSSIKSSIVDLEGDKDSYIEKKSTFSNLDPTSDAIDGANGNHTHGSTARGNINLVVGDTLKTPPVTNEDARVPGNNASHKTSFDVNSHSQLRDTTSESGQSDEMPAFLSSSSGASSLKGEKHEDLIQSIIKEIDERRKVVSSVKSIDPTNDQASYKEKEIYFSNLHPTSGRAESPNEDYNSSILSSSNINSQLGSTLETVSGTAKVPEKNLFDEKASSNAESHRQLKDTTSERFWSDELPDFLSKPAGTYNQNDQIHDNLEGSSKEEVHNEEHIAASEEEKPPPLAGLNVMNVILVAVECAPWSKTGGLGDVAGALPKALAKRGHRVMVVSPQYGNYADLQNTGVRKIYKVDGQDMEVNFSQTYIDGVDFVFIESSMFRNLQNDIYGGNRMDILRRMVLFCKAAVEVPWHVPCGGVCYGDGNLVFIANDWHTALLPVYLKAYYRDHGKMQYTRSVLVIHNIAHQGRGPVDDFKYLGLPSHYLDLFRMFDPVGGEHLNIFAAGLKAADRYVTVSHGYAWELKTAEGGWGLNGIINENDWKLMGIVNGIDTKDWNPQVDVHLKSDGYTNYSVETFQTGKAQCKEALQRELGLPIRDNVPLIGFIGRLDHQKGIDLIAEAIPWMMDQDVQLVMLGTGRKDLEDMLRHFESQHHDKIRGWVGFSVKTAHRITAGADILLMPSRFEPCGLNQLYAMSYGTVPVVHAVGGLRDTVQPFDPYSESGLGWTFDKAETDRLIHALGNCLLTYREYRNSWEGIQRRGMMQDLSWDNAAEKYEDVLVAAKYQW